MNIVLENPVRENIGKVETLMRSQFSGNTSELTTALEQLIATGGKRIRPTVALLMGKMMGADSELLLNLAAAVEMLHTATLVHDDLVDGATLRRGTKTINATWSPAATVLAGDLVFATAANLAANTDSLAVMQMFAKTLQTIVNGEITYLYGNRSKADRGTYYNWIFAKTASMFELAAGGAASLSQASETSIEAARQFGRSIGMAFQIVDDVLDFTGEQITIGKPVGSDLRQGLITLPVLYYAETHPDDPVANSIINFNGHNEDDLNQMIATIQRSGAIEQSLDEAERFIRQAHLFLDEFPDGSERNALEELAWYIIRRKK
jgi:geranylgeranyl pyrophosphate synthase